jgi:hypothetical protein
MHKGLSHNLKKAKEARSVGAHLKGQHSLTEAEDHVPDTSLG